MSPKEDKKWTKTLNFAKRIDDQTDLRILLDRIKSEILQRGLPVVLKIDISMFDIECEHCHKELDESNISSYKGIAMCKECKDVAGGWPVADIEAEKRIDFTDR